MGLPNVGVLIRGWHTFVMRPLKETSYGPLTEVWSFSGTKYGWSLRLKHGRTLDGPSKR